jgi:hypothetical protein
VKDVTPLIDIYGNRGPPVSITWRGKRRKVKRADGPERIFGAKHPETLARLVFNDEVVPPASISASRCHPSLR